ncbi:hypothetical protein B0A49_11616, partial [Cryomyces minteri]
MKMRQPGSVLWRRLKALQVYGANTDVGKTIVSTVLCKALQRRLPEHAVHYLKPVSTGPSVEEDNRHIATFAKGVHARRLFQFSEPVSPHIAARSSKEDVSDENILDCVHQELSGYAQSEDGVVIVETAGGVLSPAPSGSLQADLYRPLRLPVLLVGDHRLGGIGTSISAFESLHIRGYDVQSIMMFENSVYDNATYLREYFLDRGISTYTVPPPPRPATSIARDQEAMAGYYERTSRMEHVADFIERFSAKHDARIKNLESMADRADQSIWHPFTQHQDRPKDSIITIDSAYGDFFQTYGTEGSVGSTLSSTNESSISPDTTSLLKPAFDGSASWWTQGLGHGNPQLALAAAHASGRYGHVMFAGAVHEPALNLAETLLQHVNNPRLKKIFYTDNGSTGMEVAVKMALRAACVRYGWSSEDEVQILGLKGSYHGDTIGTMDCSEPSTYNKKVEWYRGRGHWFDFPQVKMRRGVWVVEPPEGMEAEFGPARTFESLDEVFQLEQRDSATYEAYITRELERLTKEEGKKFGALVMEPVILGAGGMLFADPLFQRTLARIIRSSSHLFSHSTSTPPSSNPSSATTDWAGLPLIHDEVFTGLYRLGRFTSSSFLRTHPDISVHAKLLTGGLVPLCVTLASQSIFDAFLSGAKSDALLHDHSYTAHAVGCTVAETSLHQMSSMEARGAWDAFKASWRPDHHNSSPSTPSRPNAAPAQPTPRSGTAPTWS